MLYLKVCDDCSFIILDLPKLQTISFDGYYALQGDDRSNRKIYVNGNRSYDNTLIMKSTSKCNMDCDEYVDLPSLTNIQINNSDKCIFKYMGHVILESMI